MKPEILVIYDINGFVAGMQLGVSKNSNQSFYHLENIGWYSEDDIFGDEVYLLTVYFIDPDKICFPGRNQTEFENEGIGNVLLLMKKDGYLEAPITITQAEECVS